MSERYEEPAFGPADSAAIAASFEQVVRTRRSVRLFTSEPIAEATIQLCLDLALQAPNSSNLQPWEFHWVRSPEKKRLLVQACMGQPAASTAAELVVCVARTRTWNRNRLKMVEHLQALATSGVRVPHSATQYYARDTRLMYAQGPLGLWGLLKRGYMWVRGWTAPVMRGPFSEGQMRLWAVKSTALACENFMLALRAHGYDSCPMEGADSSRIRTLLQLPSDAEVVMTIGCGRRAAKGIYSPQKRFGKELFVFEH